MSLLQSNKLQDDTLFCDDEDLDNEEFTSLEDDVDYEELEEENEEDN